MGWYYSVPHIVRAGAAEFIGTYILVVIGNGSIAQSYFTKGEKGDYFTINWGWALGCSLGIFVAAKGSGGHLNPAVTMALALARDFSWRKLPVYWLAQYMGALAASGTVFGIYYEAIMVRKIDGKLRIHRNNTEPGSAIIFANYPAPHSSVGTGLGEEILSTMIFMLVICCVTNKSYSKVPSYLQPLFIGFTLLAIGVAYSSNGGYALNPARDLAPRLVSYFSGWGVGVFSFRGYNWFWIFLVGPHIGAILGVGLFHLILLTTDQTDEELNQLKKPSNSIDLDEPKIPKCLGYNFKISGRGNEHLGIGWESRRISNASAVAFVERDGSSLNQW